MTVCRVTIRVKLRWWVKPAVVLWAIWRWARTGTVPETLPEWVLDHGTKVWTETEKKGGA